jgi:hypothetical protein
MCRALPLLSLSLVGCGDTVHQVAGPGVACVYPFAPPIEEEPTAPVDYPQDASVVVRVRWNDCMSSSCSDNLRATCTVSLDASTLVVDSRAEWDEDPPGAACTADCMFPHADCASAPLAAGAYTLKYAQDAGTLEIPSTVPPPCVGGG